MTARRAPTPRQAILIGTATTVVAMLPLFLTGAMAVELTGDLAFGAAGLGVAVGAFRATSAVAGPYLGRVADRLGAVRSVRLAATCAAVSSTGVAVTADGWGELVVWLMLGSCANALGQPAANRLLVHRIDPAWRGRAFGIKQSATPSASMLSGALVPLVALTIGWRWSYVLAALLACLVVVGTGRFEQPTPTAGERGPVKQRLAHRGIILGLGLAFGLAVSASVSVPTFYVDAAVRIGTPQGSAGWVLAASGVAAIVVRLAAGVAVDRVLRRPLLLCAGLILGGAGGLALLAHGTPIAMAIGALLSQGLGWGFNGVFWYAVMQLYHDNPGTITGTLAPWGLIGGTAGPVAFGALATQQGYARAWGVMAGTAVAASAAMVAVARVSAGRTATVAQTT